MSFVTDPDGSGSLPPCDCSHAGEKHRSATKGSMARACEACGCRNYIAVSPDKPAQHLTLGALNAGRRPPRLE